MSTYRSKAGVWSRLFRPTYGVYVRQRPRYWWSLRSRRAVRIAATADDSAIAQELAKMVTPGEVVPAHDLRILTAVQRVVNRRTTERIERAREIRKVSG